jgi:hypothetical protein
MGADVMRDHDDYYDDSIRLYTPVLQRVIILGAVVIAVPILMWTITTFVRSYVARPKVPPLEHVASPTTPLPKPIIAAAPPDRGPGDQLPQLKAEALATSDGPAQTAELRKGAANPNALPDASSSPAAANDPSSVSMRAAPQLAPIQAPSQANSITITGTTRGDTSSGNSSPSPSSPLRLPQTARSADTAASGPNSSDRAIAWPNPNATSPPDFAASRLPPPAAPTSTAAVEPLPTGQPLRGPIPLPRHRPDIFAVATTMAANTPASGQASRPVPLPRARPSDAPAEADNSVVEPAYGYRPGLDSDR